MRERKKESKIEGGRKREEGQERGREYFILIPIYNQTCSIAAVNHRLPRKGHKNLIVSINREQHY